MIGAAIRKHGGILGDVKFGCVGAVVAVLPVAILTIIVHVIRVGDIFDANYFVSLPVVIKDAMELVLIATALGLSCFLARGDISPHPLGLFMGGGGLVTGVLLMVLLKVFNPSPCESYTDTVASSCRTECDFTTTEIEQHCVDSMHRGDLTRVAARHGDGACYHWEDECEARLEAERIRKEAERIEKIKASQRSIEFRIGLGDASLCGELRARDVCEALFGIKQETIDKAAGRSTPAQRRTVKEYLADRGYKKIWGYIVAQTSPGRYEAAWLRNTYWGAVPTSNHFILKTTLTEYASTGTFSLWARQVGTEEIYLKSGFTETWDVYEEDAFGSVIQAIWDAPAGWETSKAADDALLGLCIIEDVYPYL